MKKVLITGGNKGIGLEATKLFLENGFKVFVVGRDFSKFSLENKNLVKVECDLSKIDKLQELVDSVGQIDILINNAGLMNSLDYDNYPKEAMERLMNINVYAPIELITQFSKTMPEGSRIVNVSSIAGQIGNPDVWYGISKAAIINATKSFAKVLAPKNIIVNAVAPGPTETDMFHVIPEVRRESIRNSVYSKRFAKPLEIAQAIYWLSTDAPEYINGTCTDLNNGAFPR